MFKNAKWITVHDLREWKHPSHKDPLPAPYLVRDFEITETVERVTLNVCGLGQAAYYLNGARIPDSIHPTQTSDYSKSVVYNTFDLTSLVRMGKNRFGAVLGHIYLADPENMLRMGTPRMIAALEIAYRSGRSESIVSGSSFLAHDSPTLFSLRRCGERYDAKRETVGWCDPETPLDGWTPAVLCASPGGRFRKKCCPPKRVFETIDGKEIAPGVFDFGENLSGWIRLRLHGIHTAPVTVLYSEWLTEDKRHISTAGLQAGTYPEMLHKDVFFPAGKEEETFEPLFTFHGFRYVEVQGAENVTVEAQKVHTDIAPLSSFECNDPTLTELHRYCERSILACAHGAMLDCPQREQNEWTGDGMLTAEVVSMEFDSYDLFYEWMQNFKDAQFPSGALPAIIPCRSNWPYSFANGLDWSSAIIHIPYYAYRYSGNPAIVSLVWENMERVMAYFATRSETHLMDFGVGDWVSLDPMCPIEITDTVYYRVDALMMAELAEALGKDPTPWRTLAEEIRREFREKYVQDGRMTNRCFTALVSAVYGTMLEENEIQSHVDVAARIATENGDALRCGIHGLRMVFDVFGSYGYNDLLLRILTNDRAPGYAKSVRDGITTLPEQFDYTTDSTPNGVYPSLNHHFTAMVDGWFFRYVAGIGYDGFGRNTLRIAPKAVRGITEFRASVRGVTVCRSGDVLTVSSPLSFRLEFGKHSGHYGAGEYTFR